MVLSYVMVYYIVKLGHYFNYEMLHTEYCSNQNHNKPHAGGKGGRNMYVCVWEDWEN